MEKKCQTNVRRAAYDYVIYNHQKYIIDYPFTLWQ